MNGSCSRREFIKSTLSASGSLLVSISLPVSEALANDNKSLSRQQINAWIEISTSNQISLHLSQIEMGQGIATALATLVGEELDVDPALISVIFPRLDNNTAPGYKVFNTGGSYSVRRNWKLMREAGAATRALLLAAAAKKLSLSVQDLHTDNGHVYSSAGDKLSYGELIKLTATLAQPEFSPKPPEADFRYIGKRNDRLDLEDIVSGKLEYGIDFQLDDQLIAVIERPAHFGARPLSIDKEAALKVPGVYRVMQIYHGVAVLAESYWQAMKARELLKIEWDNSSLVNLDDQQINAQYKEAALSAGETVYSHDELRPVQAVKTWSADYSLPYLSHATMEPMNCTALVADGRCSVWAPTQNPKHARGVAATVSGLPELAVDVYSFPIGGSFGRRLEQDYVEEAVYLAVRVDRPVKLIWSREDDFKQGWYRPKTEIAMSASTIEGSDALSLRQHITGPGVLGGGIDSDAKHDAASIKGQIKKYLLKIKNEHFPNKSVGEIAYGVKSKPYNIASDQVFYHYCHSGVPVGYLRSVSHASNIFALESSVNEIASSLKIDPLEYRKRLLGNNRKAIKVIERVALLSQWHQLPKGKGMAFFSGYGSVVALVVTLAQVKGRRVVTNAYCVADCGVLVTPDIVKAQLEGGIIFGLSAALYEQINIVDGGVSQSNFHDYAVMRMNQSPAINIELIQSRGAPGGAGELAVPVAAPALCAALSDLTGVYHRKLPVNSV